MTKSKTIDNQRVSQRSTRSMRVKMERWNTAVPQDRMRLIENIYDLVFFAMVFIGLTIFNSS